jgi:serine/threonine protein kinase/Tol biopolymer transport system component
VTFSAGSRLGPYEIQSPLGAGGMGDVYRAKDARLDRTVALKVLPEEFFEDNERKARFEREAKLLAALHHPNIAAIFAFEEASGRHLLAMELVEGEDLAQRLLSGPLPLDESLAYAKQIAEALEAAHEKGIVHRDLKPANVKVTPDGKVKLLDFGLAKIFEGDSSNDKSGSGGALTKSPTLTARATAAGVILGTAAYMSPEQARGKTVDKRTDVWAFGCVLYEMLTGKRAFEGETVSDTLAAVLMKEPDWSALRAPVSSKVRELLRRCLQRDVKQRLRDIGDARITLEEELGASASASASGSLPFEERQAVPSSTVGRSAPAVSARGSRRSIYLSWAVAAALAVALGALALRARAPEGKGVTRLTIPLPPGQVLSGNGGPAISRDGRRIAYAARDTSGTARLYLRALDRFEPGTIPESDGAQQPFFSPDGSRVAFFARGKLFTASVTGGAPAAIADASAQPLGGTWGDDDTIVFSPALSSGLVRVPAAGGVVQQLTQPDEGAGGYAHGRPQFLPGGGSVLFTIWGASNSADRGPAVLSLVTGGWQHASSGYWTGRYARSGHMMISGPRGVRAAPFDPDHPRAVNPQTFVVDAVLGTIAWSDSWFTVSDTGTLVYVPGDFLLGTLSWVDREGRVTPASDKPAAISDPLLSPDGERIAFQDRDDVLWMKDLRRGVPVRLSPENGATGAYPVWSRDGTHVIFGSNSTGDWDIYSVPATGGPAKRLLARKGNQFPLSFAPDGTLLFNERSRGGPGADLLTLAPDGTVTPFLIAQPASKVGGQFSPDGRAVAYVSDESGRDEVYVRPYGRPGDSVAVSNEGGNAPKWSPDGREIIYRRGDAFLVASVSSAGGVLSVGDSRKLFEVRAAPGRSTFQAGYSVSPDGRRFLVQLLDPRAIPTQINVVLNWFEELNAKVPVR